jgi:F-type H+-transporting ATPase subunit gamma
MATLQEISTRLKSVTNIQKITKSMKMVSAAKFGRAERSLKNAEAIGPASSALSDKAGVQPNDNDEKQIYFIVSSDRGLCGGIHSQLAKAARLDLAEKPSGTETKLVCVGDKQRSILSRSHGDDILLSANEVGRLPPTFAEASLVAQETLATGYEFKSGKVFYNHFKSAVSFEQATRPVLGSPALDVGQEELSAYDELDSYVLKDYSDFTLASSIYYGMLQGQASEQSARMSAMEAASTNAGDMIDSLQLQFNRTRQAVITRELIEIISGAAALD